MSIYVDTSAFLAIANADDPQHAAAVGSWVRLLREAETLVTTNYVIVETASLLHSRHGTLAVHRFVHDLLPALVVEWVHTEVHDAAVSAVLASSSKRSPSLVDCTSFEIIQNKRISGVFAYDRHFEGRGYDLITG